VRYVQSPGSILTILDFNPSDVCSTLFQPLCLDGIEDYAQSEKASGEILCREIDTHLEAHFAQMKIDGQGSRATHAEILHRSSPYLSSLRTTRDCLYCLQRNPEHVLECGHTLCDTCVSNFGEPVPGKEYHWKLNICHLCLSQCHFQARLLPPTCGSRLISIDGGGSRGIIPLTYLDGLQETMGLPYPIQDNFDFGIGTSSGASSPSGWRSLTDMNEVASPSSRCLQSTGGRSVA
jgi:hypothetical protein